MNVSPVCGVESGPLTFELLSMWVTPANAVPLQYSDVASKATPNPELSPATNSPSLNLRLLDALILTSSFVIGIAALAWMVSLPENL